MARDTDRSGVERSEINQNRYNRSAYHRDEGEGNPDRNRNLDDEEGYGRYAMSGRDYSTSGRYFEEDPRGRHYGGTTSYSDDVRRYNVGGYGGGRTQSDFDMNALDLEERHMASDYYNRSRRTQPEGEGGEYGFAPSDEYERGGYGHEDRNYDRESYGGYGIRGYRPDDLMINRDGRDIRSAQWSPPERGRGTPRENRGSPRFADRGDERYVDQDYIRDYRREQRGGGGALGAWDDYGLWTDSIEGPHVGRGPRGYVRSADRIKEDVCEHLTRHGRLDASDIEIEVENGEVTLTGTVDSRGAKRLAEDVTESVFGVRDVHNHLRISRSHSDRGEQQSIGQEGVAKGTRPGGKRSSRQT